MRLQARPRRVLFLSVLIGAASLATLAHAQDISINLGGQGGGGNQGNFGGNRGNQGNARYSMELFAQASNVLNHVSPTGYTGNMTSRFFGQATGVSNARDLNVGVRFNF